MSTEIEKAREWRHKYAAEHGISPDGEDVWTDKIVAAYHASRMAERPQAADPSLCGEVVQYLIAGASWFPCALPKGHEGGHRAASSCLAHGPYLGEVNAAPQCPQWPECVNELA